jgi:hypothetical protein
MPKSQFIDFRAVKAAILDVTIGLLLVDFLLPLAAIAQSNQQVRHSAQV